MPSTAPGGPPPRTDPAERARADAAVLAKEAELAANGPAAARLWVAAAEGRERAGDPEGALSALASARIAEPGAALAPLVRLATRLKRWSLAADALAAERRLAAGDDKIARTVELAELLAGP